MNLWRFFQVLVFPLGEGREPLGMCSEEKFMESVRNPQRVRKHKTSDESAEKRTRFVDTESIGIDFFFNMDLIFHKDYLN